MNTLELLVQEMEERVVDDGLIILYKSMRRIKRDKNEPPSSGDESRDREEWNISMRRDTNRPININQLQRWRQMLREMKTHSTGLHRPNETSKMM
jgi:hypothetical protein